MQTSSVISETQMLDDTIMISKGNPQIPIYPDPTLGEAKDGSWEEGSGRCTSPTSSSRGSRCLRGHAEPGIPGKNGKRGILGQFMLICPLLWFLCYCSMFLPYLWCFMWWGFWDYFAPNFHLMVWFKMRGTIVWTVGVLCLCLGGWLLHNMFC